MLISAFLSSSLLLAAALPQDEIDLVDGRVLEVERVLEETYTEVRYRTRGRAEGRKPSDQVLEVKHDLSSPLLDDYVQGLELMDANDFRGAVQVFDQVLGDKRLTGNSRYKWVVQHTLWKEVQCMFSMADYSGASDKVDTLLQTVPETFFYAPALMKKAEAKALARDGDGARKVYEELSAAVGSKDLPERWAREAELGLVLLDPTLKGKARQEKLEGLVAKNAGYPTVASRAKVEIGNTMLAEKDYGRAQSFFQHIADEGKADGRTMAAAWFGLGLIEYQTGLAQEDISKAKAYYERCALDMLRIATMHKDAVSLVPKSLYYAAVSFDRMGGLDNRKKATQVAGRLHRLYPRSRWTAKVKTDLRLR